jgi:hypothetical protein
MKLQDGATQRTFWNFQSTDMNCRWKIQEWTLLDAEMLNILQIDLCDNFKSDPGFLAAQWFNKR